MQPAGVQLISVSFCIIVILKKSFIVAVYSIIINLSHCYRLPDLSRRVLQFLVLHFHVLHFNVLQFHVLQYSQPNRQHTSAVSADTVWTLTI